LTVRDVSAPGEPISDNFWVNPFGLAFALMTVSDLILVNHKGDVIGGGKPGRQIVNLAGFTIHSAIHTARPDVNVIMHSHSVYGKAYSSLGIPVSFTAILSKMSFAHPKIFFIAQLEITTQDACVFYNDCALLADFGGVVIESKVRCTFSSLAVGTITDLSSDFFFRRKELVLPMLCNKRKPSFYKTTVSSLSEPVSFSLLFVSTSSFADFCKLPRSDWCRPCLVHYAREAMSSSAFGERERKDDHAR
jgi:hypothetical protein